MKNEVLVEDVKQEHQQLLGVVLLPRFQVGRVPRHRRPKLHWGDARLAHPHLLDEIGVPPSHHALAAHKVVPVELGEVEVGAKVGRQRLGVAEAL